MARAWVVSLSLLSSLPFATASCKRPMEAASSAKSEAAPPAKPADANGQTVAWQSRFFADVRVADAERAARIVEAIFADETAAKEVSDFIGGLGGVQSSRLWDLYFGPYDRVVSFCDGYRDLVAEADRSVPAQGRIADLGAGTGTFSAALATGHPDRHIEAIDISPVGIGIAAKKLAAVTSHFQTAVGDLKTYALAPSSLDGAVMNNVLYVFALPEKKGVLAKIHAALKPGGVLYLNDPLPRLQAQGGAGSAKANEASLKEFLTKIGRSAASNASPMTEFDLALVAAINRMFLTMKSPPFLSSQALEGLATSVGFTYKDAGNKHHLAYYDSTTTLVLRKP